LQTVTLGAALLGALAGGLGTLVVLRRQSLLGDVLSHAALPGLCAGYLVAGTRSTPALIAGALAAGALAALSVRLILATTRLRADAAMGVVLSVFFAAGLVLLTHIQARPGGGQAGLATFLFGQAAAMRRADAMAVALIAALALALALLFWKEVKLATFDPDQARAMGLPVAAVETGLTALAAMTIVVGLQVAGVVLMVALLIAPAAAARQWTRALGPMAGLAACLGAAAGGAGALVSATAPGLATGPVVVLIATGAFVLSLLLAPGRGLLWRRGG
jgi:manganese/zinc/iron transport system permease protein